MLYTKNKKISKNYSVFEVHRKRSLRASFFVYFHKKTHILGIDKIPLYDIIKETSEVTIMSQNDKDEILSPQEMANKIKTLEFTVSALRADSERLEKQLADLKKMYQFQQREIDTIKSRYKNKEVDRLLGI